MKMKAKTIEIYGQNRDGNVDSVLDELTDEIGFCAAMTHVVGVEGAMTLEREFARAVEKEGDEFVYRVGSTRLTIRDVNKKEMAFRLGQYDQQGNAHGFEAKTITENLKKTRRVLLMEVPKKTPTPVLQIAFVVALRIAREIGGIVSDGEDGWYSPNHLDALYRVEQ